MQESAPPPSAPEHLHDPGGKVRLRLAEGVRGSAAFSTCGRYRPVLWRELGPEGDPFTLWVAANPSTGSGIENDPTLAREWGFTVREGFTRMAKVNVMDYRATKPRDLLAPGVVPRSEDNLPAIRELAARASLVVLAFGALHPRLVHYGTEVVDLLRGMGVTPMCLGLTAAGAPRHPLYIKGETPLVPYPMAARTI